MLFCRLLFFLYYLFKKLQRMTSRCQTVWRSTRPGGVGLTWVKSFCKCYRKKARERVKTELAYKKRVSMIMKYHNHTLLTRPWDSEEQPYNNRRTPERQTKVKRPALYSPKDDNTCMIIKMSTKLERTQSNA